jgi:hypothetical protein
MPTYTLKEIKTGITSEVFLSISRMEELVASGEFTQIIGSPKIVTGVGSPLKNTPNEFKDILREVKNKSPKATMEIN